MIQLCKCVFVLLLLIGIFYVLGWLFGIAFKVKQTKKEQFVFGFFIYYSLFQVVALPCVFLKVTLSRLVLIWGSIVSCMVVAAVCIWVCRGVKKRGGQAVASQKQVYKRSLFLWAAILCILIGIQCYFIGVQKYVGWDTAYYIGTINDSLYTDTMYQYDGNSGWMLSKLNLRYALSMFYMNTAVLCKVFGIEAFLVQKYVIGMLCVFLSYSIVYLIGKEIWKNAKKAIFFTGIVVLLHYIFQTLYTNAQFLLYRAYEAKAFCANVVIAAILYCVLQIWNDVDDKRKWMRLFLVAFSSVPISMSSILIVPVMIGVLFLARMILYKEWCLIPNMLICVLPNAIYLVMYFLYTCGYLVIRV